MYFSIVRIFAKLCIVASPCILFLRPRLDVSRLQRGNKVEQKENGEKGER